MAVEAVKIVASLEALRRVMGQELRVLGRRLVRTLDLAAGADRTRLLESPGAREVFERHGCSDADMQRWAEEGVLPDHLLEVGLAVLRENTRRFEACQRREEERRSASTASAAIVRTVSVVRRTPAGRKPARSHSRSSARTRAGSRGDPDPELSPEPGNRANEAYCPADIAAHLLELAVDRGSVTCGWCKEKHRGSLRVLLGDDNGHRGWWFEHAQVCHGSWKAAA